MARYLASPALAGCHFVSGFARQKSPMHARLDYAEFPDATMDADRLEDIDGFLEGCGTLQQAGIMVFPGVRGVGALVDLCRSISQGARWQMRVKKDMRGVLVALDWRASCGLWSNAMGFAPLLSMPATRRAPYVALALWPGDPREGSKRVRLSFNDMPSHHEQETHDDLFDKTTALSTTLLGEVPAEAPWRKTTFAFEQEHAVLLAAV